MNFTLSPAIRKIVVFRALFLGDLICSTPAFHALRGRFPSAEISLIGLPWAQELVERLPAIDRFQAFPGFPGLPEMPYCVETTRCFVERMREEQFDLAVQFHGDGTVSNTFVSMLGARLSLGYASGNDDRLTWTSAWREQENEVRRWSRLVCMLGAKSDDRVDFPVTDEDHANACDLLSEVDRTQGPVIGFHSGAKLPSRRWPLDRFAKLGSALHHETGATIVLTGSEGERALTSQLCQQIDGQVLDLAGQTTLGTLGAVISQLDLVVTNDTGASHVAAARETPSVVLFGPSDPQRWAPLDRARHRVVDAAETGPRSEQALAALDVGPVLDTTLHLLKERTGAAQQLVDSSPNAGATSESG